MLYGADTLVFVLYNTVHLNNNNNNNNIKMEATKVGTGALVS